MLKDDKCILAEELENSQKYYENLTYQYMNLVEETKACNIENIKLAK